METLTSLGFSTYTQWSGIATITFLFLGILAFIFKWGIRFRLVGITGFMAVLTVGLFGLGLGLFTRTEIPGAVRFSRVYDNGANQMVIVVKPSITETELEATLKQAANDYFSYGRTAGEDNQLTIRVRTLIHPEPGVSIPLYLGQVKRSLSVREDENLQIEVFQESLAQLPNEQAIN
ncbi:Ycf51 family protein [Crocosphaera sp. UHCC 0190]|uniref:Ycf51 family protein n=1 Tax=Crocosphaera sp. UHCC 0190 TaxID=3110246 RepID=UPI002B20655F|nr:Ycf51 family protein [Crocosphaera sp. UHCC 0190]MEA5510799.1 Ycf51 family protein [Crocosphaera sp. UHCC 0190]